MEKTQKKVLWIGIAAVLFLGVVLAVSYQCGRRIDRASVQNTPQTQEKSVPPIIDSGGKNITSVPNTSNGLQSGENQAGGKNCSDDQNEKRICRNGSVIDRFSSNCVASTCAEVSGEKETSYYSPFIKKDANVFYEGQYPNQNLVPLIGADTATFGFIGSCASVEMSRAFYGKDKNSVYVNDKKIDSVDVNSFKYLGSFAGGDGIIPHSISISQDKNHIYYACGKPIDSIDRNTFKVLGDGYAKDSKHVYYLDTVLNKANSQSFKVIGNKRVSGLSGNFALDSNSIYYEGRIISGVKVGICSSMGIEKCLPENWFSLLDNSEDAVTNLPVNSN